MHKSLLTVILLLGLLGASGSAFSQNSYLDSLNIKRTRLNRAGMTVLGSWAIGNIGMGTYHYFKTDGSEKYYHQMNAIWNVVNFGIALPGFISSRRKNAVGLDEAMSLKQHKKSQMAFLINGFVDIGYMSGGMLLQHFSDRPKKQQFQDLMQGYGESMIIQGAFLFIFDWGMYLMMRQHGKGGILKKKSRLSLRPGGFELKF